MRGLRLWSAAAVAASTLALTSPPASAATGFVFEGTMEIGCYGCGTYGPAGNSGDFTASGVIHNEIVSNADGTMSFTIDSPTGIMCSLNGYLDGHLAIDTPLQDIQESFSVYLTGPVGQVYVSAPRWRGELTFTITSPVGNPCGGPVVANFSGELVGA